ncbi:hypothetical protein ND748_31835, partial [Frankia sp. AiPs1]|nr:hypothetical protein [Frankia sp. AiPs1]
PAADGVAPTGAAPDVPAGAGTGFPSRSGAQHASVEPASGWSIRGWSGAPGSLTGITPLTDPMPLTNPTPLPLTNPNPRTGPNPLTNPNPRTATGSPTGMTTSAAWTGRGELDEHPAADGYPDGDGYPYPDEGEYSEDGYPDEHGYFDAADGGEPTDTGEVHTDARVHSETGAPSPAGTGERPGLTGRAGGSRRLLAIVAGAVLVLLAAVAIVAGRGGGNGKDGAAPAATASLPPIPANFLDSAAVDSDPVTPEEFFPESSLAVDGRGYQRLARKLDSGCPNLTGDLIGQLKAPHCRQVVRSLFLSRPQQGGRQVLAGATVFSLDTSATATQAAQVLNQGRGGIVPLPIPAGSIQNAQITGPGGNNSWRSALSRGHYLVYTQVAYVDGTVGTATDQALRNAQTDLATVATEPMGDRAVLGHGPRR